MLISFQVGGSSGHISIAIAEKCPELHCIVQDLPEVETAFNALVPTQLKDRVTFQAHNFMTPQVTSNVNAFVLRHVLHDWPDGVAVQVLRNLINGKDGLLKDGTRIIIVDNVLPAPGFAPVPIERITTSADLQMWVACNSLERRKEDWILLFKETDERLDPVAFVNAGGTDTAMELVFRHK
jgi:6-hydroxytryprostatin B O-methyltransferase